MKVPAVLSAAFFLSFPTFTIGQTPTNFCPLNPGPQALPNNCFDACIICNLDGFASVVGNDLGQLPLDFCNAGSSTSDNAGWISFVAGSSNLLLAITETSWILSGDLEIQLFQATDCNSFTPVSDCISLTASNPSSLLATTTPLSPGERYFLVANALAGDVCTFTVDITEGFAQAPPPTLPIISSPSQMVSVRLV